MFARHTIVIFVPKLLICVQKGMTKVYFRKLFSSWKKIKLFVKNIKRDCNNIKRHSRRKNLLQNEENLHAITLKRAIFGKKQVRKSVKSGYWHADDTDENDLRRRITLILKNLRKSAVLLRWWQQISVICVLTTNHSSLTPNPTS